MHNSIERDNQVLIKSKILNSEHRLFTLEFFLFFLLSLFLDSFGHFILQRLPIVQLIFVCLCVDLITTLWRGFRIVVNLEEPALDFFALHFFKSLLCTLMRFVRYVGESLGLFGLPIVRNSDSFDFSEASESVTDIIFLERIWKIFYE